MNVAGRWPSDWFAQRGTSEIACTVCAAIGCHWLPLARRSELIPDMIRRTGFQGGPSMRHLTPFARVFFFSVLAITAVSFVAVSQTPQPTAGVFTANQAAAGLTVYAQACSACHGAKESFSKRTRSFRRQRCCCSCWARLPSSSSRWRYTSNKHTVY